MKAVSTHWQLAASLAMPLASISIVFSTTKNVQPKLTIMSIRRLPIVLFLGLVGGGLVVRIIVGDIMAFIKIFLGNTQRDFHSLKWKFVGKFNFLSICSLSPYYLHYCIYKMEQNNLTMLAFCIFFCCLDEIKTVIKGI